jgi:hypothetical protein
MLAILYQQAALTPSPPVAVFETGSYCVSQAGLELSYLPTSASNFLNTQRSYVTYVQYISPTHTHTQMPGS